MEIERCFGYVSVSMEVDEIEKEHCHKKQRTSESSFFEFQIDRSFAAFCESFGILVRGTDVEVMAAIKDRAEDCIQAMPFSLIGDLQRVEKRDLFFYQEVFSRAYDYSLVQLCEHLRGDLFEGWSISEKAERALQWLAGQDFRCVRANGLGLLCIPLEVCKLASLEILDLANNEIYALPSALRNLSNLEVLVLCDNNISDVPLGMVWLQNLVWLNLSKNAFCHFPVLVCTLQKLRHLFFSHNDICQVPQTLVHLRALNWLDLSHTDVKVLPQGCEGIKYFFL